MTALGMLAHPADPFSLPRSLLEFWEAHPGFVFGAALVLLGLLALVIGLLVQRRTRLHSRIALRERLAFEKLLTDLSAALIAASPESVGDEIARALSRVREAMDLDRCLMFVLLRNEGCARITREALGPGVASFGAQITARDSPKLFDVVRSGRAVELGDAEAELPPGEVEERAFMRRHSIKSVLIVPVTVSGDLIRGVAFHATRAARPWPADLVPRLSLVAQILVSAEVGKRNEAALRESERRYREVVDSQTDLVCRYLPDGTLTFVNEAYCRYFEKTRDALVGSSYLDLLPEDARGHALEHLTSLIQTGRAEPIEHEVLRPDGRIGWQQWVDRPVYGRDGRIVELQGMGRDVTDRKRADEASRNLAHAGRLALLGELTASIAHEVNQPLGAILSNTDVVEMRLESGQGLESVRGILEDIRRDDLRASDVIRQVRSLVRRREMDMRSLDVNEVTVDALRFAAADARRRGVRVDTAFSKGLAAVRGDRIFLQQVLLNLVINGMDAMQDLPADTRQLLVQTSAGDAGGVEISVRDGGHGIPASLLPRLFDSFVTTREQGMGLGLSISRSIVEAHGGSIRAENNAGGGATLRVSLPAAEAASAAEAV